MDVARGHGRDLAPDPAEAGGDAVLQAALGQDLHADADAQKAKLSMMGIEAKVSEREQAGRAIFRVRSGPFDDKEQAEKILQALDKKESDLLKQFKKPKAFSRKRIRMHLIASLF